MLSYSGTYDTVGFPPTIPTHPAPQRISNILPAMPARYLLFEATPGRVSIAEDKIQDAVD